MLGCVSWSQLLICKERLSAKPSKGMKPETANPLEGTVELSEGEMSLKLNFERHELPGGKTIWVGRLPDALLLNPGQFENLWGMHPEEFLEIRMMGRLVKTPRWQQAFGRDYPYSGQINKALPIPGMLEPILSWARASIQRNLNGILLNWYDGSHGHYIGRHRDSTRNMTVNAPIVTISFGEERIFRLRPWPVKSGVEPIDFPARDGGVLLMPWKTNQLFTHEVPASTRQTGRRISVTIRSFLEELGLTSRRKNAL